MRYNDKAEKIVGKRLQRRFSKPDEEFPPIRKIGEVLGKYIFNGHLNGQKVHAAPRKSLKTLDKIEKMDLRSFILPDNWEREEKNI